MFAGLKKRDPMVWCRDDARIGGELVSEEEGRDGMTAGWWAGMIVEGAIR
jgi:hypothetical protein